MNNSLLDSERKIALVSDGGSIRHVYSASGERIRTEMETPVYAPFALPPGVDDDSDEPVSELAVETVEYSGPYVYRNGTLSEILFDGGYVPMSGGNPQFHYYTQDYLGNNRAVVNGTTGALEQVTAYYPYGGVIADLGFGHGLQQFKFGGKELTTANGLNEYDFGARQHWHAIPGFNRIDPMCEKYYWLSPYLYCGNDPVNLVDPTGEAPTEDEAARMADYVYGKEQIKLKGGWKESGRFKGAVTFVKDKIGFKSMLFERTVEGATEYAYVFAGTDLLSCEDWKNNFSQVIGTSDQYETAMANASFLKENINEELTFVGHSLGGGLAAAAAYATESHAITFNAAGVSPLTVDTSVPANIEAFVTYRDELNIFQIKMHLPTANGNIQWRAANSSFMGHSIKNFYAYSLKQNLLNRMFDIYSRTSNYIQNALNPLRYF